MKHYPKANICFVRKSHGKRPLGRPSSRQQDNIAIDLINALPGNSFVNTSIGNN
jgi:hypothetical protein